MKKYFCCIALVFCMLVSILPQNVFAEIAPLGSELNPYIITNKAELLAFVDIVNGSNEATRNTAACAIVTADIGSENESISWTPMGSEAYPYTGTFKCADDVTIWGLTINSNDAVEGYNKIGLFGYIKNATIDGVSLRDILFGGDTDVGGIAGVAENSTIKNCYVHGNAVSTTRKKGIYGLESVGGMVGRSIDSHIEGCINDCFIQLKAQDGADVIARHKVGGIVGVATLSSSAASEADAVLIYDCKNYERVSCTTENNDHCTGGIAGRVVSESVVYRAIVRKCENKGRVTSIESGTGGVVGYARNASIENCQNMGLIKGTVAVGGIAGYAIHGTNIIDCTNEGAVFSDDPAGKNMFATYCGGIAGSVYNSRGTAFIDYDNGDCDVATFTPIYKDTLIKNCINKGSVTCTVNYTETPLQIVYRTDDPKEPYLVAVVGSCTGGIAGVAVDSVAFEEEGDKVEFVGCENYGAVSGASYTGGLFGVAKNITYSNCTNEGDVEVYIPSTADDDSEMEEEADDEPAEKPTRETVGELFGILTYTVRFDACGGNVKPSLALAVNGRLTSLPEPEYNGHAFDGWYSAATDGTEITTATVFNSKTTVYSHWAKTEEPTTGDDSSVVLWGIALLVSGAVLISFGIYRKRKCSHTA